MRGKVARDFLVGGRTEFGTIDLGTDMVETGRRSGLGDFHERSRGKAELTIGQFGQAQLVGRHDRLVVDDVQRGDDAAAATPDLDPGEGHEFLGAIMPAAAGEVGDGLLAGVDAELSDLEHEP